MAGSLYAMTDNMGIGKQDRLNAKLFKALLTMDAYVLVAGGDPEVRKIQQWLNGRYWRRSFATLIPTEGHYSRDVQKLLMKALQSDFWDSGRLGEWEFRAGDPTAVGSP